MARSRSRSRDRERDKGILQRRERSRSRDRDIKRKRSPSNDRERERDKEKRTRRSRSPARRDSKDPERRGRDSEREKARDKEKDREKDRDRERNRDRTRDREKTRDGDRNRDRERDRDRDRDRGRDEAGKDHVNGVKHEPGANGIKKEEEEETFPAKPKAEPLSLEELLKKKKLEQEAEAKPVFLSKKQREELALKRREEETAAQRAKMDELRKAHNNYLQNHSVRDAERRAEQQKAQEDRKRREEERERAKELELIKQQYLGAEKVKKKVLKASEKFRFNFDWEAKDDTSRDLNPLYNSTQEAALLFGRGMRAGVDRREQKKQAAEHEKNLLKKVREGAGVEETKEDRRADRRRLEAADMYDKADMRVETHWSSKRREDMTERDWRIFREDFNIAYKGNNTTILPIRNWDEAGLPEELRKAIDKLSYVTPSPIQMAAIPLGLQQRDVIGIAETGSGKTAAFVLPMLVYIKKQPVMTEEVATDGPYAVVLAPTRELAQQIEEEARKLCQYTDYRLVSVVGGQSIEDQGFKLRKGCEMVIATPGRLLDCLEKSYAVLNQCNYVVLDEADRMIDMGFEPQVMGVLDAMPSSNLKPESDDVELEEDRVYRTTYMFSATMPPSVERLARKYLRRPVVVNIGSAGRATDNVTQLVRMVKDNDKLRLLESELNNHDEKRAIVFVNTKRQCDVVSKHLEHLGYYCTVLHGGKTQDQREDSLRGFREERYNVLVATDVAGRGIDVPDVAVVVNYEMPASIEQYTHRIGRTGRAGRKGVAVTYLTLNDSEVFYDLKRLLEDSGAVVPPELARHDAAKVKPGSIADRPRRDQVVYSNK